MRTAIVLSLLSVLVPFAAEAQKAVLGKYETKEPIDKAFLATLRAVPSDKFSVKSSDQSQGTIQAARTGVGGRDFANLFVMVHKSDNGTTIIEATFTRNKGFIGGGKPEDWAQKLGDELKSDLPDVTTQVSKK